MKKFIVSILITIIGFTTFAESFRDIHVCCMDDSIKHHYARAYMKEALPGGSLRAILDGIDNPYWEMVQMFIWIDEVSAEPTLIMYIYGAEDGKCYAQFVDLIDETGNTGMIEVGFQQIAEDCYFPNVNTDWFKFSETVATWSK